MSKTPVHFPRNAQIWLPGYLKSIAQRPPLDPNQPVRVWLSICDHFEPLRGNAPVSQGLNRIKPWTKQWPEIAKRHPDSTGRPAQYTFFYPEEEYRPELLDPISAIAHEGYGDVEIHIHHDGEGQQNFIDRMSSFKEVLHNRHGLLRKDANGQIVFGFIHGNWALDNSNPDGSRCGLNNEITLLRDLGCYADFTMPSAPHPSQARLVNTIYWAVDDPLRPKSYDTGIPFKRGGPRGDLLMIPGPLALNWKERSHGLLPRIEVGELAHHNPATPDRVRLWLDHAPRVGNDIFVKLFAHGAWETNAAALLGRDLEAVLTMVLRQCAERRWEARWGVAADFTHEIALKPTEKRESIGQLTIE